MEKDTPRRGAKSAGKAKAGPGNREGLGVGRGGAGWVGGQWCHTGARDSLSEEWPLSMVRGT